MLMDFIDKCTKYIVIVFLFYFLEGNLYLGRTFNLYVLDKLENNWLMAKQ